MKKKSAAYKVGYIIGWIAIIAALVAPIVLGFVAGWHITVMLYATYALLIAAVGTHV